jgi:O-antigen/teichoic acid export membrane protein
MVHYIDRHVNYVSRMYNSDSYKLLACLASFGVIGLSGVLLNFIVLHGYGTEGVAILNQFLALYFIGSQLATFGIHQSTLAHTAASKKTSQIMGGAILLTLIVAIFLSLVFVGLVEYVLRPFVNDGFAGNTSSLFAVLILASINKILIAWLNGIGRLYSYAFSNALRMVLLLIAATFFLQKQETAFEIPYIFLISETGVLLYIIVSSFKSLASVSFSAKQISYWFKKHFEFGKRAVLSGFILDLNTKVDVLLLSLFVSQSDIGVYSFAAMLGEGFYQLIFVLKNYISKTLSTEIYDNKSCIDIAYSKQKTYLMLLVYVAFAACNIAYFVVLPSLLPPSYSLLEGFIIFLIYSLCLTIASRWLIMDNFYVLLKRPDLDNFMRIKIFLSNFVLAFLTIPLFGNVGAVSAVGFSILVNAFLVRSAVLSYSTLK